MEYDAKVITNLENWAANHSAPDKPLLVVGRASYSPKQILEEVRAQTKLGLEMYENFAEGLAERNSRKS